MEIERLTTHIRAFVTAACVTSALLACEGDSHPIDGGAEAGTDAGHDYEACKVPSDCVVVAKSCCGRCGAQARGDAIATDQSAAYRSAVCGSSMGCPACAPLFIDPTLVATCRNRRCELVDLLEHESSACSADDDCRVRTPDCCPCGGDTSLGRLIGVSSEHAYSALVCDPDQACDECAPIYPGEVTAFCDTDDHCETRDTR
jgi:hypothetical protein